MSLWVFVCMRLCRPGTRRLRATCSWPRSAQTRPSGTTSWQPAGTCWFRSWPSSCLSYCSSTWARLRAPLTFLEKTASRTSWTCSAGRLRQRGDMCQIQPIHTNCQERAFDLIWSWFVTILSTKNKRGNWTSYTLKQLIIHMISGRAT